MTIKDVSFIHLNFILPEKGIINCLPEKLQEDVIPKTVYSLSNTSRNEFFNYNFTLSNINTDDTITYRADICSCICAYSI